MPDDEVSSTDIKQEKSTSNGKSPISSYIDKNGVFIVSSVLLAIFIVGCIAGFIIAVSLGGLNPGLGMTFCVVACFFGSMIWFFGMLWDSGKDLEEKCELYADILDPQLDLNPNQGAWILENGILKHDGKEVAPSSYEIKLGNPKTGARAVILEVEKEMDFCTVQRLCRLCRGTHEGNVLQFKIGPKGDLLCFSEIAFNSIPVSCNYFLSIIMCEAVLGRMDAFHAYMRVQMNKHVGEVKRMCKEREQISLDISPELQRLVLDFKDPMSLWALSRICFTFTGEEEAFVARIFDLSEKFPEVFKKPVIEKDGGPSMSKDSTAEKVCMTYLPQYVSIDSIADELLNVKDKCGVTLHVPKESSDSMKTPLAVSIFCAMPEFKLNGRFVPAQEEVMECDTDQSIATLGVEAASIRAHALGGGI